MTWFVNVTYSLFVAYHFRSPNLLLAMIRSQAYSPSRVVCILVCRSKEFNDLWPALGSVALGHELGLMLIENHGTINLDFLPIPHGATLVPVGKGSSLRQPSLISAWITTFSVSRSWIVN